MIVSAVLSVICGKFWAPCFCVHRLEKLSAQSTDLGRCRIEENVSTYTVLSLNIARLVDVKNIRIEELTCLYRGTIGRGMSPGVVTLLRASSSTELGVERTLEDSTAKIRVIAVLIIRCVDSRVAIVHSRAVARNTSYCIARVSVGSCYHDLELTAKLSRVYCVT